MNKTSFTIAFDGPALKEGRMDVRELAPALLALGHVIEASNRAIHGPDYPVRVEAVATGVGSFLVGIDVVYPYWEQLRNLLVSSDTDAALKLLEIIGLFMSGAAGGGGLIALLRQLGGKRITSAGRDPNGGGIVVRFPAEDGAETSVVVPAEVLRLYQEVYVQRELAKLLATLESEAVETITFVPTDPKATSALPVVLSRTDRGIAQQPLEMTPETVIDTTQRMALSIRSLAFTEGNKWRLYDGQNIITATIEDKEFLERVDRSLARFAKGDILICSVRTVQKQSADGLKTDHAVLKVQEHRPAPTQLSIPFDRQL